MIKKTVNPDFDKEFLNFIENKPSIKNLTFANQLKAFDIHSLSGPSSNITKTIYKVKCGIKKKTC